MLHVIDENSFGYDLDSENHLNVYVFHSTPDGEDDLFGIISNDVVTDDVDLQDMALNMLSEVNYAVEFLDENDNFSKFVSCYTTENTSQRLTQVKDTGRYDVVNVDATIIRNMAEVYGFNESELQTAYQKRKELTVDSYADDMTVNGTHTMLFQHGRPLVVSKDVNGMVVSESMFRKTCIANENVGYLVAEHIPQSQAGADLLVRCYHEPFRDLADAEAYQREQQPSRWCDKQSDNTFQISVVDVCELESSKWYQTNMQCAAYMQEHGITRDTIYSSYPADKALEVYFNMQNSVECSMDTQKRHNDRVAKADAICPDSEQSSHELEFPF